MLDREFALTVKIFTSTLSDEVLEDVLTHPEMGAEYGFSPEDTEEILKIARAEKEARDGVRLGD